MTLDFVSIADFVIKNRSDLSLLIFIITQCFWCFVCIKKGKIALFFMDAAVYFPALVLLVASLFFNTTWNLLSGYVVGSSLISAVSMICWNDKDKHTIKTIINILFTVWAAFSLILG